MQKQNNKVKTGKEDDKVLRYKFQMTEIRKFKASKLYFLNQLLFFPTSPAKIMRYELGAKNQKAA